MLPCQPADPEVAAAVVVLEQDASIHQQWADYLVYHPELATLMGSISWHVYWRDEYERIAQLLCRLDPDRALALGRHGAVI